MPEDLECVLRDRNLRIVGIPVEELPSDILEHLTPPYNLTFRIICTELSVRQPRHLDGKMLADIECHVVSAPKWEAVV